MNFRRDNYLLCVDPGGETTITKGKVYQCSKNSEEGFVELINDKGQRQWYYNHRFNLVSKPAKTYAVVSDPLMTANNIEAAQKAALEAGSDYFVVEVLSRVVPATTYRLEPYNAT